MQNIKLALEHEHQELRSASCDLRAAICEPFTDTTSAYDTPGHRNHRQEAECSTRLLAGN